MELEEIEIKIEVFRNIVDVLLNLKLVIKILDMMYSVYDMLVESLVDSLENFRYLFLIQFVIVGIFELSLFGFVIIMLINFMLILMVFIVFIVIIIWLGVIFQVKFVFIDLLFFKCEVCEKEFYVLVNYIIYF